MNTRTKNLSFFFIVCHIAPLLSMHEETSQVGSGALMPIPHQGTLTINSTRSLFQNTPTIEPVVEESLHQHYTQAAPSWGFMKFIGRRELGIINCMGGAFLYIKQFKSVEKMIFILLMISPCRERSM